VNAPPEGLRRTTCSTSTHAPYCTSSLTPYSTPSLAPVARLRPVRSPRPSPVLSPLPFPLPAPCTCRQQVPSAAMGATPHSPRPAVFAGPFSFSKDNTTRAEQGAVVARACRKTLRRRSWGGPPTAPAVLVSSGRSAARRTGSAVAPPRSLPPLQGPDHGNIPAWRAAAEWVSSSRRCVDGLVSVAGLAAAKTVSPQQRVTQISAVWREKVPEQPGSALGGLAHRGARLGMGRRDHQTNLFLQERRRWMVMTPSSKGAFSTFFLQQRDATHSAVGPPATRCLCIARVMGAVGRIAEARGCYVFVSLTCGRSSQ
jgi:hypothetical protein